MLGRIIRNIRTKILTALCKRTAKHVGKDLHINHWCKFSPTTIIGDNCHFNGIHVTGKGNVVIGNNFHSASGIMILTSNHNYDSGNAIPYDETTVDGDVIIEDNVWLGQNVTILQGVAIGEDAIIQTGSVVVSNIAPCAIAGGHPAKVFKYRDKEHYDQLKAEGKFM